MIFFKTILNFQKACLALFFLVFLNSCYQNKNISEITDSEIFKSQTSDIKDYDFYPTSTSGVVVHHDNYSLSYVEQYELAEWVAYELTSEHLKNTSYERPYFIQDPKVSTGSADWRNYKNSGYDRGHLCPAGDMKKSEKAYNEAFYTSNIAPQKRAFNNGIWHRLEQKVRYWADKYNGLYVITGCVLKDELPTIGKEKVAVPEYFYKILLDTSTEKPRMIAFLIPHRESKEPLYNFVVSVDKLEELTGIDFFHQLPDSLETKLESSDSYKEWSFR